MHSGTKLIRINSYLQLHTAGAQLLTRKHNAMLMLAHPWYVLEPTVRGGILSRHWEVTRSPTILHICVQKPSKFEFKISLKINLVMLRTSAPSFRVTVHQKVWEASTTHLW